MSHKKEWLIQLLSQNRIIFMHDGLGTFIQKTHHEWGRGWTIRGRDDTMALLPRLEFDDLSSALFAAKSVREIFIYNQKQE